MTLAAIVAVPVDTDIDNLPDETARVIDALFVKHADMTPSQPVNGYRVVIAHLANPSPDDPLAAIEGLLAAHSLDWTVLHLQDYHARTEMVDDEPVSVVTVYKQRGDTLAPYIVPQPIFDADGNQTGTYTPGVHVWLGQAGWV